MVKRVLKWLGIVVVILAVVAAAGGYAVFGNNSPMGDGPVANGVTAVKDGFVNVFIVDLGSGKVALVDAGRDKSGAAVLAALARKSLGPASVSAIFLTHGHPDHTAACKLFPDATVYAMAEDAELVGDAATVHPLHDGQVVTVGDEHIEAFAVPGHTPGSAVYLARGVLFLGDSAGASKAGNVMKAVRLFSKDSAQNVASLKALSSRLSPQKGEVKAMAFGHTGPLQGLGPLEAFASEN
jgi:hydroxyacylglutathione hydrolase